MNPKSEEEKGRLEIKLRAAFLGAKFLPRIIAFANNNFNPKLILSNTHIEYRAFLFTNRIEYREIEKIDILIWIKTNNIYFIRNNSFITVSANAVNENDLIMCLRFLMEKGCILTERAQEFFIKNEYKVS